MGLENVKNKKLLYHLTKIDNIPSIIEYGLIPRGILVENGLKFRDVADSQIIQERKELGLEYYTPFHFHPYSAFDVAVKSRFSSDRFAYICIKRSFAAFSNFKILTKHPLSQEECILYDYQEGFDKIDWNTMEKVGATDEYSRCVKMAECLTNKIIPADLIQCVYVADEETKKYVETLFRNKGIIEHPPYVSVQSAWFGERG